MMDTEITRLMAAQVPPHHNILKEVQSNQKRQIYQAYEQKAPMIIEYGSETIKAGYSSLGSPSVVFRPHISKTRDPNKGELPVKAVINLSYDQLDFSKSNFKSAFEKNIILHFSILEQCNDYILSEIVKPGKRAQSSLIISEPLANPIHCRASILGQLFECYGFQEVLVGVDALFAYFYQLGCDMHRYNTQTALVVSVGASTIHVLCIVQGKVDYGSVRRINVGGSNAFELFSRTLLLKNPQMKSKFTYTFLRDLYENYTTVAQDYREQLRYFERKISGKANVRQPLNPSIYHNRIHEQNRQFEEPAGCIDMVEIDFDVIIEVPEEEIRRKEQMKLRMAEKLRETIERRKQLKRKMQEIELNQLAALREKYENGDKEAHEEVVEMFGPTKFFDKLLKKINLLEIKLGLAEEKADENKYSLVDIPDHELTSEKLKLKRIQIYQKNMIEAKRKKIEEKQLQEQKMRDLRQNNPQIYLQQLKEKYKALSEKAKQKERIKNEMNNRKSRLKQKRMQALARMAEEEFDEENFEEQEPQAAKQAEDSDHYSELQVMEAELREIDPEWNSVRKDIHHLNSGNQLIMNVELVKCHEIYFEPRIVGCNQAGIIETIKCVLEQFSSSAKARLLNNIVVVGGGSVVPGLGQRIARDLTQECEAGSCINVTVGKGGYLGAYLAMREISKLPRKQIAPFFYHKSDYAHNTYKSNPWSNPQPKPL